ncbi:hypothetical protein ACWDWO_11905 [Actinopolymorpha singaporensis]
MKILYGRSALVRGALAGAIAVGLGVSGCSRNIEPETGKTPSPSTTKSARSTPSETPTPTPTRTPTPTPTAPSGSVEEQLHAATVNFYSVIRKSYQTLDTHPIGELLVPGSDAASGYTNYIDKVKAKGGHFKDLGGYQVSDFRVVTSARSSSMKRVEYTLTASSLQEIDKNGNVVETIRSSTWRNAWIYFQQRGGRWLIVSQNPGERIK